MKRLFCFLHLFFFISLLVFSQTPQKLKEESEPWRVLEKAELAFKNGDYGTAIELAETAKLNRIAQCEWNKYVLNNALRVSSIRHAGDKIDFVLKALKEDDLRDAFSIVDLLVKTYGLDYFDNSINNLYKYVSKKYNYPEAEYLIGKIYQIESEYSFAFGYYDKAFSCAEDFDVPDEKYDVLYSIAELSALVGDFDKYEKTLLLILDSDTTFKDKSFTSTYMQVLNNSRSMSPDRFFQLYRGGNVRSIQACNMLSDFYEKNGEADKSLSISAFGVIAAVNHISNVLSERDNEYRYTTLLNFFVELSNYDDIVDWGINNSVWKAFYNFATKIDCEKNKDFVHDLYIILSECEPEEYWRIAATNMIKENIK